MMIFQSTSYYHTEAGGTRKSYKLLVIINEKTNGLRPWGTIFLGNLHIKQPQNSCSKVAHIYEHIGSTSLNYRPDNTRRLFVGCYTVFPEFNTKSKCVSVSKIHLYIYSHPGVDRISDMFKNDFQK